MSEKRLYQQKDGEWVEPKMRGYVMGCCDCGLQHRINFRVIDGKVQFQAFRKKRKNGENVAQLIRALVEVASGKVATLVDVRKRIGWRLR
jgi:hypothetical protein